MHVFAASDGAPVRRDTDAVIAPWWSFTKPVLAAAALSLVRDGLLTLDDELPGVPYTLRQLLRHEAGLADYGELDAYHQAVASGEPAWTGDEMMRRLDAMAPSDRPGTRWRYSNVGYMKVASLILDRTGLDLAEALRDRVLTPLDMTGTRLARTRADLADVVMGEAAGYDPGWLFHGLLVGPLSDAAGFLSRLFRGHPLPEPLLREMKTARSLGGPLIGRPWVATAYGLGLMQGEWSQGKIVHGHTGSGPGSTLAVYHHSDGHRAACVAVFGPGAAEGQTEAAAERALRDVLAGAVGSDATPTGLGRESQARPCRGGTR